MGSFATSVRIEAPKERVWEVLSDLGSIYKWNPGITHSYTTSEAATGENAMRQCDLPGGGFLRERAFNWSEGEGFTIEIYETSLPMKESFVDFRATAEGEATVVKLKMDYKLKFGPVGALLDAVFVGRQARNGMAELLGGLKEYVETGKQANASRAEEPAAAA
ncbi:MAG: SRPBCC family protein [Chloroflexi bacterium]|nr:SRPBCC family protein [Chloroflexota bacterium]MCI0819698.1 SRPBCC family protein [Chloroflexota bacterium]MCI0882954.1 SRPBCC family protein [Chloroflexota bacterium]